MADKSTTFGNALLNWLFRGSAAPTLPGTWYIAAYTDTACTTEVSGGSYARVGVTRDTSSFAAASGKATSNLSSITFPSPTGNYTINGIAVTDASSGGTQWYFKALAAPVSVTNGGPAAVINVGDLDIEER